MCHSGELKKKGKLFHEKILQLEYFGHVKCFKFKMCVCVCVCLWPGDGSKAQRLHTAPTEETKDDECGEELSQVSNIHSVLCERVRAASLSASK